MNIIINPKLKLQIFICSTKKWPKVDCSYATLEDVPIKHPSAVPLVREIVLFSSTRILGASATLWNTLAPPFQ